MNSTEKLPSAGLWKYFLEISKIPRASYKEQKMISFLLDFGKKHHLETLSDAAGNVLIRKPAAKGYEKKRTVCLQSHLDMVAEKNSTSKHDFDTDPIEVLVENGWVKANGTTLGADNGIGIAAQLAILTDPAITHGPLECLFTVEEEVGLKGAGSLQPDFLRSDILINLDSEDEGELFIGCAGGIDTIAVIPYKSRVLQAGTKAYKITVSGLKGGHSGDDINKDRGNSIKILNRILWNLSKKIKINISVLEGGNLRNAIPREAYAVFAINVANENTFLDELNSLSAKIKEEYAVTEPGLSVAFESVTLPGFVLKRKSQERLLNVLYACPHGVVSMSRVIENLVQTSTNLASVKFTGNNEVTVSTSQRSSVEFEKQEIANTVRSVFDLAKAKVSHSDGYPGWNPDADSEILKITNDAYKRLFGTEAKVKAIHAGLECGMFKKIFPRLDMISFGPTLRDVHSPDERMEIESVGKFWDLLVEVLKNTP